MANARMTDRLQRPVGASILSAFYGSGSPGAPVRELGVDPASGVGRWEPEVQSWTLRSGVKAGVGRTQELHVGTGWKGRDPGAVPELWVWVGFVWVIERCGRELGAGGEVGKQLPCAVWKQTF